MFIHHGAKRLSGYLMIIAASILFGINGTVSRLLLDDGISAVTLAQFRMLFGGCCLYAVLLASRSEGSKKALYHWRKILAFGVALALVTYCYFLAISRLPIAVALVIEFSAAAWMTIGESLWKRTFPSFLVVVAIVLTLGGAILVTDVWHVQLRGLDGLGLLYACCTLIAYSLYLILGRRVGQQVPALYSTTWGALIAALCWFTIQPPWTIPMRVWQGNHIGLLILVGVIGMAIPFALMQQALRYLDAARVGIASMLEIVAAAIVAYFWLGQHLNWWQIAGCAFVFVGIALLQSEH